MSDIPAVQADGNTQNSPLMGSLREKEDSILQVNLDMTDSMGPGKLVRHMQNPSYTYDEYLICIGLGPSYSGPSYPSSPVFLKCITFIYTNMYVRLKFPFKGFIFVCLVQ